jgi:Mg-chelatase subunit ChlD
MTTNPNPRNTHIVILLDRSGSMESIASDIVGGFNQFMRGQAEAGTDARVTFVQFDSENPQEVIVAGAPIAEIVPLTRATFVPRGGTPLLDATGQLISRIEANQAARETAGLPKEDIVFVSITDGEENESREFTLARIRQLVTEKQAQGWTFVFLSAALDVYGEAQAMGIGAGSVQAFRADARGTGIAFADLNLKMTQFRTKKRQGLDTAADLFFGDEKPAEDHRDGKTDESSDE